MSKLLSFTLLGLFVGLVVGYYFAVKIRSELIPKGYVLVTVDNKSGHNIRLLYLKHGRGTIETIDLAQQETVNLTFKSGSENSYRIIATLDNGSVISSTGAYVESGYKMSEIVLIDSIKTAAFK